MVASPTKDPLLTRGYAKHADFTIGQGDYFTKVGFSRLKKVPLLNIWFIIPCKYFCSRKISI
jgi:hypothetical protein